MQGPDRSLLRLVNPTEFADSADWRVFGDIPEAVILSLSEDPNTSFWDEGCNKETLQDVLLALALERRNIATMHYASLWQQFLDVDLALRIIQCDDDGPYVAGRVLHYELGEPRKDDYPRLALGIAKRQDRGTTRAGSVKDLIEDAIFTDKFNIADVSDDLRRSIDKMLKGRFIKADELIELVPKPKIVDIREKQAERIPDSISVDYAVLCERRLIEGASKSASLVLYCDDGERSRRLARELRDNSYRDIKTLYKGFAAWKAAGLPTSA